MSAAQPVSSSSPAASQEPDGCCICSENQWGTHHVAVMMSPCLHMAGYNCLQSWFNHQRGEGISSPSCPFCRAELGNPPKLTVKEALNERGGMTRTELQNFERNNLMGSQSANAAAAPNHGATGRASLAGRVSHTMELAATARAGLSNFVATILFDSMGSTAARVTHLETRAAFSASRENPRSQPPRASSNPPPPPIRPPLSPRDTRVSDGAIKEEWYDVLLNVRQAQGEIAKLRLRVLEKNTIATLKAYNSALLEAIFPFHSKQIREILAGRQATINDSLMTLDDVDELISDFNSESSSSMSNENMARRKHLPALKAFITRAEQAKQTIEAFIASWDTGRTDQIQVPEGFLGLANELRNTLGIIDGVAQDYPQYTQWTPQISQMKEELSRIERLRPSQKNLETLAPLCEKVNTIIAEITRLTGDSRLETVWIWLSDYQHSNGAAIPQPAARPSAAAAPAVSVSDEWQPVPSAILQQGDSQGWEEPPFEAFQVPSTRPEQPTGSSAVSQELEAPLPPQPAARPSAAAASDGAAPYETAREKLINQRDATLNAREKLFALYNHPNNAQLQNQFSPKINEIVAVLDKLEKTFFSTRDLTNEQIFLKLEGIYLKCQQTIDAVVSQFPDVDPSGQ